MNGFQRGLLWSSSLLTGLTGVVYFWMKHFLESSDPWAVINHPLQPWMLKAHILAAPFLVFALGLITPGHIWKQLRSPVRRNRISGAATLWMIVPMVLTGYLIQAVTHPGWLSGVAWTHTVVGAVYLLGMLFHGGIPGRAPRSRAGEGTGP